MKALVSKFGKASRGWRTGSQNPAASKLDLAKPTDRSPEAVKAYNQRLEQAQSKSVTGDLPSSMTAQDVISHNKNAQSLDQLIKPHDRSLESVRAYNERLEELKSKARPESKATAATPAPVATPAPETAQPELSPSPSTSPSTANSVRAFNEALESKPRERMSFQGSWKSKDAPEGWRQQTGAGLPGSPVVPFGQGVAEAKSMTPQEVIAHNQRAMRLSDLIMPTDRSTESIRAYNERRAELSG